MPLLSYFLPTGGYIVDGNIKPVFKHATFISKAIV